jgi:Na+-translocating ferredoxin:NAD+ oxidoreductase RnfE subunit
LYYRADDRRAYSLPLYTALGSTCRSSWQLHILGRAEMFASKYIVNSLLDGVGMASASRWSCC